MRFFRVVLWLLQAVSPHAAAWLAERLFFTARRTSLSPAARAFLASGRRFVLSVENRRVTGWSWGRDAAPAVYLVHGWASRGARLAAFTEPLRDAGYAVVTYDAPGHGASGRGMSSMPEFARTLAAVVAHHGRGRSPHAVIAHSFGCSATSLALLWGLDAQRLVFLAPAADPPAWVAPFVRALALRPQTADLVRTRSERRIRYRWADLHVCDIARSISRPPSLLVVHDESDETVRWQDGAAIAAAWPDSQLVTTQGLGHRGVTSDARVVREAVTFIGGDRPETAIPTDEAGRLEYEMFFREERRTLNAATEHVASNTRCFSARSDGR